VHQDAQAVDVGRGRDRAAAELLGRRVVGREDADGAGRVAAVFLDEV
jgi:hypothetical protein